MGKVNQLWQDEQEARHEMEEYEQDYLDQDKDLAPSRGILIALIVCACVYGGVWFAWKML